MAATSRLAKGDWGRVVLITHLSDVGRVLARRRAFSNLIENGAIYGEAATVRLAATAAQVKVEICDRGPGIPPEHHKNCLPPSFAWNPLAAGRPAALA